MSNNKQSILMKNKTIKINGTGTINGVGVLVTHESNTFTSQIHKFEPIQTYPMGSSSNSIICAKCGKQGWEHPIITYTEL